MQAYSSGTIQVSGTMQSNLEYTIFREKEHFELYLNGKFYCSGDNLAEINEEIAMIN